MAAIISASAGTPVGIVLPPVVAAGVATPFAARSAAISSGVRTGRSHAGAVTELGVAAVLRTGPAVEAQTEASPTTIAVTRRTRVGLALRRPPNVASSRVSRHSEGVIPRHEGSRRLPRRGAESPRLLLQRAARRNDTNCAVGCNPRGTLRVGECLPRGDQLAAALLLQLLDPLRGVVEEPALGLDTQFAGGDLVGHRLADFRRGIE